VVGLETVAGSIRLNRRRAFLSQAAALLQVCLPAQSQIFMPLSPLALAGVVDASHGSPSLVDLVAVEPQVRHGQEPRVVADDERPAKLVGHARFVGPIELGPHTRPGVFPRSPDVAIERDVGGLGALHAEQLVPMGLTASRLSGPVSAFTGATALHEEREPTEVDSLLLTDCAHAKGAHSRGW